jgi:cobalt-zinc-cadmium efflux system outer membrane protein
VKHIVSVGCLAVWSAGLLVPCARAQTVLTLPDAVARALANHPRLAAEAGRIAAAQGLVQQAGLRPNARLYVQSENWRAGAPQPVASVFTDQFLYASQLLETGGKRARRLEAARAGERLAEQDRQVIAREIALRVKLAYWAAWGEQQVVELLRSNQQNLLQAVQYHEIQVREGAMAEADLLRVRLEADRGLVALETAERDANLALIALFREMGETEFPPVRLVEPADTDFPVAGVAEALQARPDLLRARQAVDQARANLRLQQASAKPDVEVLAGYKRTMGFDTFLWGVQVALPFTNRNQGNIAAAQSLIRAAEAEQAALEAQIRAEVESARRDAVARRQQLETLLTDSLDRAREVVQIARAAYREGGTDLLRLLDAERAYIDLEILNARLLTAYRQSLVVLETALGGVP